MTRREAWGYWRSRGFSDATRDRAPIFRNTRSRGFFADGEGFDVKHSELTESEAGEAYLEGYDAARVQA